MTLKFYVKNQTLAYCGNDTVASGSKNYLYAAFRFTKEWAGLAKTAVFISADGSRRYHMLIEGGRCSVPAEMIAEGGFYVSVFGGDRITSTQVYIDVAQSGVEPGLTPPEPTEDVYSQILTKVDDIASGLDTLCVTGDMIADGAVSAEKLDVNIANDLHAHTNKNVLDMIDEQTWSGLSAMYSDKVNVMLNEYEISDFKNSSNSSLYDFPFEEGEIFEIYNETTENIDSLPYNDYVEWRFSQTVKSDTGYLIRLVTKPVSTVDEQTNGELEIIREMPYDKTNVLIMMYNMINELNVQMYDMSRADDVLAALLSEGV